MLPPCRLQSQPLGDLLLYLLFPFLLCFIALLLRVVCTVYGRLLAWTLLPLSPSLLCYISIFCIVCFLFRAGLVVFVTFTSHTHSSTRSSFCLSSCFFYSFFILLLFSVIIQFAVAAQFYRTHIFKFSANV